MDGSSQWCRWVWVLVLRWALWMLLVLLVLLAV
jgi:hypothetical protein